MEKFEFVLNNKADAESFNLNFINQEIATKAQKFHASFPQYSVTPLAELKNLSKMFGVKNIFVKDESYRFGLNAFKVLGGSFAIGNYIAGKLGMSLEDLPYEKLVSKEVKDKLGELTFVTATDGNHGRGIAWSAHELHQKCVVIMPEGSAVERRDNIRALGAECEIMEGLNYDDCVRLADKNAKEKGWIMVQDTAWEGYEEIPTWIIQGYSTLAKEALEQLKEKNENITHIFVQAGVGSFAAGVAGIFRFHF